MRAYLPALIVLFAATGAACGTDTSSSRLGEGDTPLDTSEDLPPIDAGGDDNADDADDEDAAGETDSDETTAVGSPGDPCAADVDCDSGICVDVVAGDALDGFCSRPCNSDAECPSGFDCVLLTGSWDAQRICVPVDLCIDADADGYGAGPGCDGPDCDDDDVRAHAGRNEVCDGLDNDCDGTIDDAPTDANVDCDTGFPGVCGTGRTACEDGLLACRSAATPTAETCDSLDNDCDGSTDEDDAGDPLTRLCYDDNVELIGVGVCAWGLQTCADGGFSGCSGQQLPQPEACNALDDNCDGEVDEALATTNYFVDLDGDGFGDGAGVPISECARPTGYVENAGDCDDSNNAVRPGATEIPGDAIDQNCDGSEFCYEDSDGDRYRPDSAAVLISLDSDCDDPGETSAATPGGDCDDDQAAAFPGNPEVCDDLDNNCNRRVDEGAGCYPNGDACLDPSDCASALCEDGLCVRPLTCVDLGRCPPRITATAGGGQLATGRFVLKLSAGAGTSSPVLSTPRFRMTVGAAPYVNDP